MSDFKHNSEENYIEIIQRLVKAIVVLLAIIVILLVFIVWSGPPKKEFTIVKSDIKTESIEKPKANGLTEYNTKHSPISPKIEGRAVVTDAESTLLTQLKEA